MPQTQPPAKVPRIGLLLVGTLSTTRILIEAFRQGLRDLGYVEDQHIVIEYRWGEGNIDRLPDLAAELVQRKVDLIVAAATTSIQAAQQATTTIPIVIAVSSDPVDLGCTRTGGADEKPESFTPNSCHAGGHAGGLWGGLGGIPR
jgi:putative tryptophan/tyrosine transport system substrate-binding protein